MATMRAELEAELAAVDEEYKDRPGLAHDLARTPFLRELGELRRRYGEGLDTQSHGESFLRFFGERLVPNGTYFLDEPEAPLSPARQLSFLALLKELVAADGQAIIATHSPSSSRSRARSSCRSTATRSRRWRTRTSITCRLTRDFLADPEAFLRHL